MHGHIMCGKQHSKMGWQTHRWLLLASISCKQVCMTQA
jgi:hypothetical protein